MVDMGDVVVNFDKLKLAQILVFTHEELDINGADLFSYQLYNSNSFLNWQITFKCFGFRSITIGLVALFELCIIIGYVRAML